MGKYKMTQSINIIFHSQNKIKDVFELKNTIYEHENLTFCCSNIFLKVLFRKQNYNVNEYSPFFFIFYASPFHIHRTFNNKRNISDLQKNTTITFNVNSLHFDPHIRIFIYVPWNLKIHLMRLIIILDWIYGFNI